jgi:hypothetical protein
MENEGHKRLHQAFWNKLGLFFSFVMANTFGPVIGHCTGDQISYFLYPPIPLPPNTFINIIIPSPIPRVTTYIMTGLVIGFLEMLALRNFAF